MLSLRLVPPAKYISRRSRDGNAAPQTSLTLPPPAAAVSADRKGGGRPSGAPALAQLEGQRTPPVPPGQGHGVLGSVLRGAGVGGTRGKETNCALATPPPPRSGPARKEEAQVEGCRWGAATPMPGSGEAKSGPNPFSSERTRGRPGLSFHTRRGRVGRTPAFSPGWVPFPGFLNRGVKAREQASTGGAGGLRMQGMSLRIFPSS